VSESTKPIEADRRSEVLSSALKTFARFGYRKTSMEEVARAARISRPGLYFLFASKEDLFRDAVLKTLDEDLADVARILGEGHLPIDERLLHAFDCWAGRYVGPMSRDITAVIDDNPELLGEIVVDRPERFAELITSVLVTSGRSPSSSAALARTLISTSIGIKHQVQDRAAYRTNLAVAIELLLS
jgi:AcrR family transcriptional regulator